MPKKVADILGKSMFKVGLEYKLHGETVFNNILYTVISDTAEEAVEAALQDMKNKNPSPGFANIRMLSVERKGTIDLIVG